ncbi:hypothetical protein HUO13_14920 [Saccharopolyspora erythraea]|nr:hypothetical protein [Saccharopolyspora erythraea]QUH01927.1 hypothetical protein HUO13_14920 [Saccharopolyspora erythraea]
MTGALVAQLCQMAAARATMRWAVRVMIPAGVRAPWPSIESRALAVLMIDSVRCRISARLP